MWETKHFAYLAIGIVVFIIVVALFVTAYNSSSAGFSPSPVILPQPRQPGSTSAAPQFQETQSGTTVTKTPMKTTVETY